MNRKLINNTLSTHAKMNCLKNIILEPSGTCYSHRNSHECKNLFLFCFCLQVSKYLESLFIF